MAKLLFGVFIGLFIGCLSGALFVDAVAENKAACIKAVENLENRDKEITNEHETERVCK